jgi:hypothetical protein
MGTGTQRKSFLFQFPIIFLKNILPVGADNLYINGALLPDANLVSAYQALPLESALRADGLLLAWRTASNLEFDFSAPDDARNRIPSLSTAFAAWDIFSKNGEAIQADFSFAVNRAYSQTREQLTENGVVIRGKHPVFVHRQSCRLPY